MSDYRRYFVAGGTYFFTVVTHHRKPIFTTAPGRQYLGEAIRQIKKDRPFNLVATVLLPDHWHLVMGLPRGDKDYSMRMKRIKEEFTKRWKANKPSVTDVWQPRFWEHTVRDLADLENCVDYIHWNPRKHDLTSRVRDWEYSSFHRFVREGHYPLDWGGVAPKVIDLQCDWGEP